MTTCKLLICAVVLILAIGVAAHALTKNSEAGAVSCGSSSIESSGQAAEAVGEGCCPKKSSGSKSTEKSCPKSSKKSGSEGSGKGCPKSSEKSSPKK